MFARKLRKFRYVIGTPRALSVLAVSPANGATGVNYTNLPIMLTLTKNGIELLTNSVYYLVGVSTEVLFNNGYGTYYNLTQGTSYSMLSAAGTLLTLTPNTTYTIRFIRGGVTQTDGETTSNCGVMTDIGGVCTSTFTTMP